MVNRNGGRHVHDEIIALLQRTGVPKGQTVKIEFPAGMFLPEEVIEVYAAEVSTCARCGQPAFKGINGPICVKRAC